MACFQRAMTLPRDAYCGAAIEYISASAKDFYLSAAEGLGSVTILISEDLILVQDERWRRG